jgi:hypothetical protein
MTPGERPRLQDSNLVFAAALLAIAALAAGLVVGVARVESAGELLWNPRPSPWLWLPLGLAALALLVFVVGIVLPWRVGAAASFLVMPVGGIAAGAVLLVALRRR